MATIKNQFKIGSDILYPETSADCVTYSDTTVKAVLDTLAGGTATSFVNQLLACNDAAAVRNLLRIAQPHIFNEGNENHLWTMYSNSWIANNESVFGDYSLRISNNSSAATAYVRANKGMTLGGEDFAIDCWVWMYSTATIYGPALALASSLSTATNQPFWMFRRGNGTYWSACWGIDSTSGVVEATTNVVDQAWHHVEVDYQHSTGSWYIFTDGVLEGTATYTMPETKFNYALMGLFNPSGSITRYFNGYIDELRVTKGITRHTANFTPPSSQYTADDYTAMLLHFD